MVDLEDANSTDVRSITEQDIKFRVAKALFASDTSDDHVWAYISYSGFDPLNKPDELCRLLMDNWDGIDIMLSNWFHESFDDRTTKYTWTENPEFLANKELWILRALVAYKESRK